MATQIASTLDLSCLELVSLLDVFPDLAGGPTQHTVKINASTSSASLSQSNKSVAIRHGDTIRWKCSCKFKLSFHAGKSPKTNGGLNFDSTFVLSNSSHLLEIVFDSTQWTSNLIQLDYDIEVQLPSGKLVTADPSVIIDIALDRLRILRLKEGCSSADVGGVMNMAKPLSSNAKKPSKSSAAARSTGKRSSTRRK